MQQALGAKQRSRADLAAGRHDDARALEIGNSIVMVSDASEHAKAMPVMLYLYVPNVDAAYQLALKGRRDLDHGAGGSILR